MLMALHGEAQIVRLTAKDTLMTHDLDPFSAPISKRRPLLGTTLLLVEDSRFCSEAVRLMTLRSGARLRRADCVRSARKHLAMYRPDLVIVDIGLPDGSGVDLIKEVRGQGLSILAMSGTVNDTVRTTVMEAGANGFMPKPIGNMKQFQAFIMAAMDRNAQMPGFAPSMVDAGPELDQQALLDDLDHIRTVLTEALPNQDMGRITYCVQFVASVAQTAHDQELLNGTAAFFQGIERGEPVEKDGETMLEMIQNRLKDMPKSVTGAQKLA